MRAVVEEASGLIGRLDFQGAAWIRAVPFLNAVVLGLARETEKE